MQGLDKNSVPKGANSLRLSTIAVVSRILFSHKTREHISLKELSSRRWAVTAEQVQRNMFPCFVDSSRLPNLWFNFAATVHRRVRKSSPVLAKLHL